MSTVNWKPKLSELAPGDNLPPVIKRVTQKDINLYAQASGDLNPLHIDEEFAAKTPLGGTIAHGMLILAYVSEMIAGAFGGVWYTGGRLSARFKAPVRPKDTITISGKVDSIRVQDDTSLISCSVEARNQNGEVVISGEAAVKNYDLVVQGGA